MELRAYEEFNMELDPMSSFKLQCLVARFKQKRSSCKLRIFIFRMLILGFQPICLIITLTASSSYPQKGTDVDLWANYFVSTLSISLSLSLLCFEIIKISFIFNLVLLFHVVCVLRHYIILTEHRFVIGIVVGTLLIFSDVYLIFELINIAKSYRLISTIMIILFIWISPSVLWAWFIACMLWWF